MRIREKKESDQQNAEKAYQLLLGLIEDHQHEIEPALWVGTMIGALAENYEKSDIPFEFFRQEINNALEHYKY